MAAYGPSSRSIRLPAGQVLAHPLCQFGASPCYIPGTYQTTRVVQTQPAERQSSRAVQMGFKPEQARVSAQRATWWVIKVQHGASLELNRPRLPNVITTIGNGRDIPSPTGADIIDAAKPGADCWCERGRIGRALHLLCPG